MFAKLKRLLAGTLRRQLIIGMTLVVASILSLSVFEQARQEREQAVTEQSEQALALARSVAASSAVWVASRDYAGLQEIVGSLKSYPDLRHVVVLNRQGQVLGHSDPTRRGMYMSDLPKVAEATVLQRAINLTDIASPVMLSGLHIGWIRIGMAQNSLNAKLATLMRQSIFFALMGVVLSALVAALAGHYLTRRLYVIQKVARAIRAGQSGLRAELSGSDEAAQLAGEFNVMLDALEGEVTERRQAEIEAQRAGDLLRGSIDALEEGFVLYDPQDRLVLCNDKYREIYSGVAHLMVPGAQFEDLLRVDAEMGLFPAAIGRVDEWVAERMAAHLAANATVIQKHSNGRTLRIVERRLPDGHIVGFRVDISESVREQDEILRLNARLEERVIQLRSQQEELRQSTDQIRDSEAILSATINTALDGVVQIDPAGIITRWNNQAEKMFGWLRDEAIGLSLHETIIPPQYRAAHLRGMHHFLSTGEGPVLNKRIEISALRRDGHEFPIELSITPLKAGDKVEFSAFVRDITERKQYEKKRELAASVFTHAREGIVITDAVGTIVDVNDTFTRITGYLREEALGQNPRILKSDRQPPEFHAAMWGRLTQDGHWSGEIWNRRKNGDLYAAMQTVSAVRDASGTTQHYISLFIDITTQKEQQQQLEHIAHYDALTNLPNRMLLDDRLHQAMLQSQRRGKALAVAYLDLDGFKQVNDIHGHAVGDEMLVLLSQHIKAVLREGDTLARIGGDEFVVVLVDLENPADCKPVLARLLQAASQPVTVGDAVLHVSASIGVTLCPQDGTDADLLLRYADQAMYIAKDSGKNRCHFFDAASASAVQTQRESLRNIAHAMAQHEFVLYYQPKVNMKTGAVVGAEALIRWQHPVRGLLAPAAFLPLIENHPLSVELGEWVIATAIAQMGAWRAQDMDLSVSVNIGAHQLQQPDFAERLGDMLAGHPDLKPHSLQLEVLETSALQDMVHVGAVMQACKAIGVGFALDDFGTGYSSLTYLKRLPAESLKIDQSFVRDMLIDQDDMAIVQGVIGLAKVFRRSVIAEGVETHAHGALLLKLGCELAQGYGIARPMPAADLPAWVQRWHTTPVWTA